MVLLSESQIKSLLDAVPSFEESWREHEASEKDYEERFSHPPRTEEERRDDFLWHLALHLSERVARGELHEAEWLAAALERIYESVSEDTAVKLTVSFLESLVIQIQHAGGDASVVTPLIRGPRVAWRWRQAYSYYQGVYLYNRGPDE